MITEIRKAVNQARRDRTREKLLDAAALVFQRKGYHGALVSDVVVEAGVGQGTFYRHFESKRELFDALFDRVMVQIVTEVAGIAESLPENIQEYREASVRGVAASARVLKANGGMVQLFFTEGPSVDAEFRAKLESVHQEIAAMAAEYLRHAMSLGFARECHTRVISQMLVGAGVRLVNEYFNGHLDDIGIDGAVREAVEFAFSGFGPGSGGPSCP